MIHNIVFISVIYQSDSVTYTCQKGDVLKKQFLLEITLKKEKYLGINLFEEVKELYAKNYKTLIREIEDDSRK